MSCEYRPGNPAHADPRTDVICKRAVALQHMFAVMEQTFTVAELGRELCENENPEARNGCEAYCSLAQYGKRSSWAK